MRKTERHISGTNRPQTNIGFAEEIALVMAFIAVIFGIGTTNFAPALSYRYWISLTVVLAVLGSFIASASFRKAHKDWRDILKLLGAQMIHWAATLITIICVYLLLRTGRLNYEGAGLVMGLVLGFGTLLDGILRVGWRFALLGAVIMTATMGAAYLETYIWIFLLILAIIWALAFLWGHRRHKHKA